MHCPDTVATQKSSLHMTFQPVFLLNPQKYPEQSLDVKVSPAYENTKKGQGIVVLFDYLFIIV